MLLESRIFVGAFIFNPFLSRLSENVFLFSYMYKCMWPYIVDQEIFACEVFVVKFSRFVLIALAHQKCSFIVRHSRFKKILIFVVVGCRRKFPDLRYVHVQSDTDM